MVAASIAEVGACPLARLGPQAQGRSTRRAKGRLGRLAAQLTGGSEEAEVAQPQRRGWFRGILGRDYSGCASVERVEAEDVPLAEGGFLVLAQTVDVQAHRQSAVPVLTDVAEPISVADLMGE